MIIPYYIEKREGLRKHYISIFNINGAHGFLYKRLIEALGIPVLIITDLDIQRNEESGETDGQEEGKEKVYKLPLYQNPARLVNFDFGRAGFFLRKYA